MASPAGLYRSYAILLSAALLPIWTGARSSVVISKSAKRKLRSLKGEEWTKEQDDDLEDDEDDDDIERMTREDAYWFPVLGSCALFGLFLAFKFLPKVWVNRVLGVYMATMAVAGLARTGVKAAQKVVPEERWKGLNKWKLALTKNNFDEGQFRFTMVHVVLAPLSAVLSFAQHYTGHWVLSNLVALSFAFNALSLLYLDSFATGSFLLAGLFLYDIWWVFGSKAVFGAGADVMVKVATSFDAPIKLLAPKDFSNPKDMSLLGLGDIVLPGIFISLALRFDYHQALKRAKIPFKPTEAYPKPYFYTVFIAYIAGLATTILVMHTFRAAQPALLYLSPACILSVSGLALLRGEWKDLWGYVDGEEDEKERREKEEAKAKREEGKEE